MTGAFQWSNPVVGFQSLEFFADAVACVLDYSVETMLGVHPVIDAAFESDTDQAHTAEMEGVCSVAKRGNSCFWH